MFSTLYTNYTPGNTADDGIDLFGGNRWFEGAIVGQADTRHLPSGTRFELVYTAPNEAPVTLTTSGEILGNAYGHMSLTATAPTLTDEGIFYFDATNGRITVLDPTAMNAALQGGNYNFRLVAIDANNNVIDDHSFMVRMQSWGGLVYTGTDGNDGNAAAATGGIILSNPNTAALAGAGDDHVMLASTGHKVQLGEGNDAATITGMNFGSVYGGAGEDRLVLGGSATDYNFISSPDVVRGVETIEFGGTGKSMRLNLQEIFEMTDGGAFALTIRTANTAITGNLFLDIDGLTVSGGTLDQSGTAVGSGNVTLQGMYNGQTVTLIIEQGNTSGGVVVNDV